MLKLLLGLYLAVSASFVGAAPPSDAQLVFEPASSHGDFIPRPEAARQRPARLRLTSVLSPGGEPYAGTLFHVVRDQPAVFGKTRSTVMALAGPEATAEFDLNPGQYRVLARNGAVTVEQAIEIPARGSLHTEVVLNAGELQLTASMDDNGNPADAAWFRVLRQDTDSYGKPTLTEVASDGYGDSAGFVLPAGDYVAETRYGDADVRRPVSVRAGQRSHYELPLDAGHLELFATLSDGEEPVDGARYTLLRKTGDPASPLAPVAQADSGSAVTFILPQGDYLARARLDRAIAEAEVRVRAGETTSLELPLRAGELFVHATLAGGDHALLDSWFDIAPITGQDTGTTPPARGPDDQVRFVLPAGSHRVLARHGESSGSADVVIEPGESQILAVELNAGRISASLTRGNGQPALPHAWFSVYRVEYDGSGRERRRRVYNDGYHRTTEMVLPSGEYIAFAHNDHFRGEAAFVVEPGAGVQSVQIIAGR